MTPLNMRYEDASPRLSGRHAQVDHDAPVEVSRGVLVAHEAEAHLDGGDLVGSGNQLNLHAGVRGRHRLNMRFQRVIFLSANFQLQVLAGFQGGGPDFLHGSGIVLFHGAFDPFITANGGHTAQAQKHGFHAAGGEQQSRQQYPQFGAPDLQPHS